MKEKNKRTNDWDKYFCGGFPKDYKKIEIQKQKQTNVAAIYLFVIVVFLSVLLFDI